MNCYKSKQTDQSCTIEKFQSSAVLINAPDIKLCISIKYKETDLFAILMLISDIKFFI